MTTTDVSPVPSRSDARLLWRCAAGVAAWGSAVLALSLTGGLSTLSLYVLPALIGAGMAIPLLTVSRSPALRRIVREINLAHLTWFNTWRVLAATAFFVVGARGLLPARFVTNAAWGDLAVGALAPVVVLVAARLTAPARVRAYLVFHLLSFGDFVVAVGTGLTFTLLGDPLMRTLLDTPMALIPLWGVPLTGTISLLALHRLLTQRA